MSACRRLGGLAEKFKVKGRYYGIPQLTTFGTLLFYNKNLFDQAGIKVPTTDWDDKTWTFDVMLDYARRLTQRSGEPDAIYGLNYSPGNPHVHTWLWGGDTFLPEHYTEGIAQRTTIDSQQSVEGHQFVQDIRWKHRIAPRTGTDPTTVVGFLNGRYAMDAWYKRFENTQLAMTRADIEKVTQGAINPKRSQENADHTIIEWSKISALYTPNIGNPLNVNQGTAREVLAKAKPLYDSTTREIYEQFKGKTPT